MVSINPPISRKAEVVRCRIRLIVSLDEASLLVASRHFTHNQQTPGLSRIDFASGLLMLAHFKCNLIAQNSQEILAFREPDEPEHTSASHLCDLVILATM